MAPPLLHQSPVLAPPTEDAWRTAAEVAIGDLETRVDQLPAALEAAISRALRQTLTDPAVTEAFWEKGFEELTKHATAGTTQWFGRRVMVALVLGITGWCLVWLAKGGYLK